LTDNADKRTAHVQADKGAARVQAAARLQVPLLRAASEVESGAAVLGRAQAGRRVSRHAGQNLRSGVQVVSRPALARKENHAEKTTGQWVTGKIL